MALCAASHKAKLHQLRIHARGTPTKKPDMIPGAGQASASVQAPNRRRPSSTLTVLVRRLRSGDGAGQSAATDSDAAAAGGLIAALELGYQEAKQGAWMARGFVAAFLDAGGAAEVRATSSRTRCPSHALSRDNLVLQRQQLARAAFGKASSNVEGSGSQELTSERHGVGYLCYFVKMIAFYLRPCLERRQNHA